MAVLKSLKRLIRSNKKHNQKYSYSQSGEDLIIKYIFDELRISNPSYIDIGAHHPFFLSNTALFYESGSRGINVEPDPGLFTEFIKYRKNDINLNIGIGTDEGEADFFIISAPTLNTFSREEADKYKNEGNFKITRIVKTRVNSIKNIITEHHKGQFPQLLALDAEGVDEVILKSIDYAHNYPLVICTETLSFSTSRNGVKKHDLIAYVASKGYMVYADTYINTIFVRKDIFEKNVK